MKIEYMWIRITKSCSKSGCSIIPSLDSLTARHLACRSSKNWSVSSAGMLAASPSIFDSRPCDSISLVASIPIWNTWFSCWICGKKRRVEKTYVNRLNYNSNETWPNLLIPFHLHTFRVNTNYCTRREKEWQEKAVVFAKLRKCECWQTNCVS